MASPLEGSIYSMNIIDFGLWKISRSVSLHQTVFCWRELTMSTKKKIDRTPKARYRHCKRYIELNAMVQIDDEDEYLGG